MSSFNTSMFQSIKDALNKNENEGGNKYTEIMKTVPGNTYTVRLLPYTPSPKDTFFHYFNHGWTSFATGQYVQALSPTTFGERDPIAEERFRQFRTGTEEEKEKVKNLKKSEKFLVNVYVVEDQSNPDNNGKVKILRYGKQLHKIIMEAIEGEDAEEFGPKIFDLSNEGVNFKIKCETQGEFPTYVSSRFTATGKLNLDKKKQDAILESVHDLTKVFPLKSYDELQQMLDEHYHCKANKPVVVEKVVARVQAPQPTKVEDEDPPFEVEDDFDINELLKDL